MAYNPMDFATARANILGNTASAVGNAASSIVQQIGQLKDTADANKKIDAAYRQVLDTAAQKLIEAGVPEVQAYTTAKKYYLGRQPEEDAKTATTRWMTVSDKFDAEVEKIKTEKANAVKQEGISKASLTATTGLERTGQADTANADGSTDTGDIVRYEGSPDTVSEFKTRANFLMPSGVTDKDLESNKDYQGSLGMAQTRQNQVVGGIIGQQGQVQSGAAAGVLGLGVDTKQYNEAIGTLPNKPVDPMKVKEQELDLQLKELDKEIKRQQARKYEAQTNKIENSERKMEGLKAYDFATKLFKQADDMYNRSAHTVKVLQKAYDDAASSFGDIAIAKALSKNAESLGTIDYRGGTDKDSLYDALVEAKKQLEGRKNYLNYARNLEEKAKPLIGGLLGQAASEATDKTREENVQDVIKIIKNSPGFTTTDPDYVRKLNLEVPEYKQYPADIVKEARDRLLGVSKGPAQSASTLGYSAPATQMSDAEIESSIMSNPNAAAKWSALTPEQKKIAIDRIKAEGVL